MTHLADEDPFDLRVEQDGDLSNYCSVLVSSWLGGGGVEGSSRNAIPTVETRTRRIESLHRVETVQSARHS